MSRPADPADQGSPAATGSVEVETSAEAAYALLTDLGTLAELAEETEAMTWRSGTETAARPGAVFTGANRNGWRRWSTTCTVVDADPGHRFSFDVTSIGGLTVARWQYDLEELAPGRCRVTESTWDHRPAWFKRAAVLVTGVADRDTTNHAHIAATLARLQARVA